MNVLALSSSRAGNSDYLQPAVPFIQSFLGNDTCSIAFIPFAAVNDDYEAYGKMVREGLSKLPHKIITAHPDNARSVIENADVIMIGGGNTFKLLHNIYAYKLFNLIVEKVKSGAPYIGWSAGANLAGPTIGTTNDMPIIEPESFNAFGFLPYQVNPHYLNQVAEGFHGETRDQRLAEFLLVNPQKKIVGLPEGSALIATGNTLIYEAIEDGALFELNHNKQVLKKLISPGQNISFLLNTSLNQ